MLCVDAVGILKFRIKDIRLLCSGSEDEVNDVLESSVPAFTLKPKNHVNWVLLSKLSSSFWAIVLLFVNYGGHYFRMHRAMGVHCRLVVRILIVAPVLGSLGSTAKSAFAPYSVEYKRRRSTFFNHF